MLQLFTSYCSLALVNILFVFLDSLLGCGITDDGVKKICELVRANLVKTVQ